VSSEPDVRPLWRPGRALRPLIGVDTVRDPVDGLTMPERILLAVESRQRERTLFSYDYDPLRF
jgi:hypothetical protein